MNNILLSKKLLYYFIFLFLVLISWRNPDITPPTMLRVVYLFALMVPTLLFAQKMMPIVITLFYVVSNYSCYISYMPNQVMLYVIFPIMSLLYKSQNNTTYSPSIYLILFIYTVFANLLGSFSIEPICACFLLMVLFTKLSPMNDSRYVHLFSCAFILSSLVIGLQFMIEGKQFQENFNYGELVTRTQWMDPNYLGCVIGLGSITALIEALFNKTISKKLKYLLFSIFGFLCAILILNASRGALLATLGSSIILFLKSDIQFRFKVATILCFLLFLYFLYVYGFFDFLLLRIELDEGRGGSGRTDIWATKIQSYSQLSFFDQLFGIGYQNGMRLGFGTARGFHNDYIAFLIEYGVIGLMAFIFFLISFLRKANNFWIVFAIVLYVVLTGATLEPISGGMLSYFCFLFYGKLVAKSNDFANSSLFSFKNFIN